MDSFVPVVTGEAQLKLALAVHALREEDNAVRPLKSNACSSRE